ncbi:siderophore-iron reductase FhuF [Haemophilus paracuniculus]|nr:siderophore-iron reductase FhuF [Haemophilus paracuniculus]
MNLLITCSELNQLRSSFFPEMLKDCRDLLTFVEKPQGISNATLFQQLKQGCRPTSLAKLFAEPRKAHVSIWQRFWLGSFLMHWVWLLHKHQIHLVLSEQQTALRLQPNGEVDQFLINLYYTPVHKIAKNGDYLPAYQQLKQFLSPIFTILSEHSRLNEAVFWHNTANLIEYSLKQLEQEGVEISTIYAQLFDQKKWGEYEYNPFHSPVEYIDFPALPFPQPCRLRKVCCHAQLEPTLDYCGNCPKLKRLCGEELQALVEKWKG